MDWVRENLSRLILGVSVTIIIVMTVILINAMSLEREARARSLATADLIGNLQNVLRVGVDAETGQRGFLLTGQTDFLQPYEAAQAQWLEDIADIRGDLAVMGVRSELRNMDRLREVARAKLVELDNTIALSRSGQREAAIAMIQDSRGKRLMDEFRFTVRGMEQRQMDAITGMETRIDRIRMVTTFSILFLLLAIVGLGYFAVMQDRKAQRAALLDREAVLLREGKERADLIANELNHRVKNLFAVILSLVTLSARGRDDKKTTIEKIHNRIHALSTAHSIGLGGGEHDSFEITKLLSAILAPYRDDKRALSLFGPEIDVPAAAITPLGLILHELATNAVKYGGLSKPSGEVKVAWQRHQLADGDELLLTWAESGGPVTKSGGDKGFGSTMIAAAVEQLRGEIDYEWLSEGVRIDLRFPI